ncbi:helix-turn-helix domain-containing protein [Nocardia amikacinitolerans]|uniref:helix-turn-helix domain-containing protein n=1 Tax=Nocardia amikacinitolerans TaxID=756689 RepID=UPI0035567EB4
MTAEQIRQARAVLSRPEESVSSVARLLGVSRSTIYKHLPELRTGSGAAAALSSSQLPEQPRSVAAESISTPVGRAARYSAPFRGAAPSNEVGQIQEGIRL